MKVAALVEGLRSIGGGRYLHSFFTKIISEEPSSTKSYVE